jgi:serine/threonine-protein kinase
MERIGRFEILQELGRGAMGAVYQARDPQIGRIVAIKVILTASLDPQDVAAYRQRFQREAQAAGRMSHPGIVTIYDFAEDEAGQPYLVMEFVEGTPLDKLLAPGTERLPLSKTLNIAIQVARALDYAHRRGVIHRDVKPANILLTAEGIAKIADFGVAKLAGTQLTQVGQMVGTPAFMSPEQFSGATVDARSDLFSLGAALYWMCTGERPFAGDTLTSISFKVVYAPHIPARQLQRSLPEELDTVLSRALAKNPGDRYASCAELAADLEAIVDRRPIAAKPLPVAEVERTVVAGAPPVVAPPVVPQPARRSWARIAAVSVAVLALIIAAIVFWPQEGTRPDSPQQTAAPPPKPVPMSTLRVVCEHNFRIATLEISAGGKVVLGTTLRGKERVISVYQGLNTFTRPIPAGEQALEVRVEAPEHDYSETGRIEGTFTEGRTKTLRIEFGKGSGLGVISRKLTLAWQ